MARFLTLDLASGKVTVSAGGAVGFSNATFTLDSGSKTALKAALTLAIGDVSGLQAALDAKASTAGSYANPSWITSLDAAKLTGTIDLARLPALASGIQVVSTSATIAGLSSIEQAALTTAGAVVTTTDGRRWVWNGVGSKVLEASYVELADITPAWAIIAGKPTTLDGYGITDAASQSELDAFIASVGTAAYLNVGIGANMIPQFDMDGGLSIDGSLSVADTITADIVQPTTLRASPYAAFPFAIEPGHAGFGFDSSTGDFRIPGHSFAPDYSFNLGNNTLSGNSGGGISVYGGGSIPFYFGAGIGGYSGFDTSTGVFYGDGTGLTNVLASSAYSAYYSNLVTFFGSPDFGGCTWNGNTVEYAENANSIWNNAGYVATGGLFDGSAGNVAYAGLAGSANFLWNGFDYSDGYVLFNGTGGWVAAAETAGWVDVAGLANGSNTPSVLEFFTEDIDFSGCEWNGNTVPVAQTAYDADNVNNGMGAYVLSSGLFDGSAGNVAGAQYAQFADTSNVFWFFQEAPDFSGINDFSFAGGDFALTAMDGFWFNRTAIFNGAATIKGNASLGDDSAYPFYVQEGAMGTGYDCATGTFYGSGAGLSDITMTLLNVLEDGADASAFDGQAVIGTHWFGGSPFGYGFALGNGMISGNAGVISIQDLSVATGTHYFNNMGFNLMSGAIEYSEGQVFMHGYAHKLGYDEVNFFNGDHSFTDGNFSLANGLFTYDDTFEEFGFNKRTVFNQETAFVSLASFEGSAAFGGNVSFFGATGVNSSTYVNPAHSDSVKLSTILAMMNDMGLTTPDAP